MILDLDIYRSANVLVRQHGQDAPIEAAMRADAMLDKGDLDGYAVWKRILRAVEELQGTAAPRRSISRRRADTRRVTRRAGSRWACARISHDRACALGPGPRGASASPRPTRAVELGRLEADRDRLVEEVERLRRERDQARREAAEERDQGRQERDRRATRGASTSACSFSSIRLESEYLTAIHDRGEAPPRGRGRSSRKTGLCQKICRTPRIINAQRTMIVTNTKRID